MTRIESAHARVGSLMAASSSSADALYNRAITLPRSDTARANLLREAIEIDANHGRSYLSLGADTRRSGNIATAVKLLRAAASLLPSNAAAQHALGEALLANHQPAIALPHLEAAVAASPAHSPYEYVKANALLSSFRLEEAADSFARAATLNPAHALHTARNDERLSPAEQVAAAMSSARRWHERAQRRVDTMTRSSGTVEGHRSLSRAHIWRGETFVSAGICAISEVGTMAQLEKALEAAADKRLPILLRNATAVAWRATGEELLDELSAASGGEATCAEGETPAPTPLIPVALLFPNRTTNRVHPFTSLEGRVAGEVLAAIRAGGVGGVLQRPLIEYMSPSTLLALLRNGICTSRCYAKQVRLDLYLPRLLRHLRPPRLGAAAHVSEVNLWLGGAREGAPITTEVHRDAQANLILMAKGRKSALLIPPADGWRLKPMAMVDVTTTTSISGAVEEEGSGGNSRMVWPQSVEELRIDTQHYGVGLEEAKGMLVDASKVIHVEADFGEPTVCAFEVGEGDGLFVPPGWLHAVETVGGGVGAAVNVFYEGVRR